MRSIIQCILAVLILSGATGAAQAQIFSHWEEGPALPRRIANNAVAALTLNDTCFVFTFMGIDSTKIYSGITTASLRLNTATGEWSSIAPVPGSGRIAASAVAFKGKIYIFGGYIVHFNGRETTVTTVDVYDPALDEYALAARLPVGIDDQVAGVWRDSLIYMVSGWSNTRNVKNVQVYNPTENSWAQATPLTGPGLFGHAGALSGDVIVYEGGVKSEGLSNFELSEESYIGRIDPNDPLTITWEKLPDHPGRGKYRMAAGTLGHRILFSGGTSEPYNFDGIGYNNTPAEPDGLTFGFNTRSGEWETYPVNPFPTMDHRGLVRCGNHFYTVGGFESGQEVTTHVSVFVVDSLITSVNRLREAATPTLSLHGCAPHPLTGTTQVEYTLRRPAALELCLYDAAGRLVLHSDRGLQRAGRGTVPLNAAALPTGVYSLVLRAAGETRFLAVLRAP